MQYPSTKERGVVLAFCLVLLLVTTLLGVAAMSTTALEESMTQNERDQHTAFQAAEAALREGERYVKSQATSPTIFPGSFSKTCANGLCFSRENTPNYDKTKSPCETGGISDRWDMWSCPTSHSGNLAVWTNAKRHRSHANTSLTNSKGITTLPKYIIEFMGYQDITRDELYRITSFATGGTDDAKVMLQSTYHLSF
ncbi:pilus assembly PilX family protein [Candidatus Vondammii sp. HM_W22]|uniref:pilus assembly PilX family protein n=1 Tax=Candidatus Vondammii sp. HM_W22 TaxID=2687299 RepID=UPI001F133D8C|nr:PilX N-terminal domain-containing pilus assembly protein [Candidatus Vondammii sp. HM_W22]